MVKEKPNAINRFALPFFLSFFFLSACSDYYKQIQKVAGSTMGTRYSIQFYPSRNAPDKISAAQIKKEADKILDDIDKKMSTYRQDSELSALNNAEIDKWIRVSPELFFVLQAAQQLAEISNGAFDVTVGSLVNSWNFGPEFTSRNQPSEAVISELLTNRVGYQYLQLDVEKSSLRKLKPVYVDLSAIAKGYAVDRLAELLLAHGMVDFLVEFGGELRASGKKANGQYWRVAIEKPAVNSSEAAQPSQIIELKNTAIATSGDYRNFYIIDGRMYSHVINPENGKPVSHNLASVTVLHVSTMMADALATMLLVLGPEKSMQYASEQNLPIFLVLRDGDKLEYRQSSRFNEFVAAKSSK